MTGFEHDPYQPQRPTSGNPQPWGGHPTSGPAFDPARTSEGTTASAPPNPPHAGGPGPSGPPSGPWSFGSPMAPTPPERPRRKSRMGVALLVAGTIAASGVAGGVAGTVASHQNSSASASTGAPTSDSAVNTPISNQTGQPTTAIGQVAKAALPTVVQVTVNSYQGKSVGSGVILSADGKILTNNHVVAEAAGGNGQISVTFNDGRTAQASIVGTDSGSDLAVIQAQSVSGLPTATLGDSDKVQVGDTVIAIGSPDGLQSTVTSGIVSALNRQVTVSSGQSRYSNGSQVTYKAIQTDASLNPGNSGGPLLNAQGQVIGVNSAIYSPTSAFGGQGGSVGLGFSIPVNQVKALLGKLEGGQSS
ncbi:S1C family serine protease [Catenulispora subtropica]|uniref:Trypsin-like peptidase domain-containing protein n=1 Tax=Catenulispora subtropica TaxID=450798 RepID=A0ABN2QVR5_9ACTN